MGGRPVSNKQYEPEEWEEFRKAVNSGDYSRVQMRDGEHNEWLELIGDLSFRRPWQYRIAPKPPEPEGWTKLEHVVGDAWYFCEGGTGGFRIGCANRNGIGFSVGPFVTWSELRNWHWTRDPKTKLFYTCTVEPQLVTKP